MSIDKPNRVIVDSRFRLAYANKDANLLMFIVEKKLVAVDAVVSAVTLVHTYRQPDKGGLVITIAERK